jgi:hypothetical protein
MNQLPEHDLPPGRHRLLKEHLMTEIRQERPARRPWLRPALVAGAVAAVAAVTLTLTVSSGDSAPPPATAEAVTLLEDIALAAEHRPSYGEIRDDQFVYVDSKVSYSRHEEGKKAKVPPLHRLESWQSVDGTRAGLMRETGRGDWPLDPAPQPGEPGYETSTTYEHLETLPTDADAMYDWLHEVASEYDGETEQAMFVLAADLMRQSIVPPEQGAALFRAVARIPGVTVIEDAVDAAGRHGVAIAREDPTNPTRDEWIFDRKTFQFLGERRVVTEEGGDAEVGTVLSNTAVLRRAIVDEAGQRP